MSLLVNDLMTLSKLETDESEFNQIAVPVKPLLLAIKNEAEALVHTKNHTTQVTCDGEPKLKGNEKELHSVFSNLVFNAVKYSPEGGNI